MNFLNKEYSKYDSTHKSWKNGLFSATVVLLIFLLFQPFGLQDKDATLKLFLFPTYALSAFLFTITTFAVVRNILNRKRNWTIKDELLSFIPGMIILTLAIHVLSYLITGDMPFNLYWYFKLFYHCLSLFLIISILEFFYYSNKSADVRIENLSSQINTYSRQIEKAKIENNSETVTIALEKDSLNINRNKVAYIQSSGNYLEIFLFETGGQINKIVKRGRIHQAEKDLENCLEFFRCHRAFIVNLKHAKQMKGNSKNARLIMEGYSVEIPVSRSYFTTLKEQLQKIIVE